MLLPPHHGKLPSFKITAPAVDNEEEVARLARDVFCLQNFSVSNEDDKIYIAREPATDRVVEWMPDVGVIWFADERRLWNPDLRPTLPPDAVARAAGKKFLIDHGLLPTSPAVKIGEAMSTSTRRTPDGGTTPDVLLDLHVAVPVGLSVEKIGDYVTVIGRGLKWSVTYGEPGQIINCVAACLNFDSTPQFADAPFSLLSHLEAIPDLLRLVSSLPARVRIAPVYERLPDPENGEWLTPIYLLRFDTEEASHLVRLPGNSHSHHLLTTLEARVAARRTRRAVADDDTVRAIRGQGLKGFKGLGAVWSRVDKDVYGLKREKTITFVDEMVHRGWKMCEFDDAQAKERHWNLERGDYVEQADFAFYSGHAGQNGWTLAQPDDDGLNASEITRRLDPIRYGRQFLNWILIDACGPLQDPAIQKTTDGAAFGRWPAAFEGLLGFCGFASTTLARADAGPVLARALAQQSVTRAWFRACRECQPSVSLDRPEDGFDIWAATLTWVDGTLKTYDLRLNDNPTRTRAKPHGMIGVWTPA